MELPFQQQIWLAVIDKALLGTMAIIVGAVATVFVERYKTRQAIHTAMAPERLKQIGALNARLRKVERELRTVLMSTWKWCHNRPPVTDRELFARLMDPESPEYAEILAPALETWGKLLISVSQELESILRDIAESEFWLGNSATRSLKRRAYTAMMLTNGHGIAQALYRDETSWLKRVRELIPYWMMRTGSRIHSTSGVDAEIRKLGK